MWESIGLVKTNAAMTDDAQLLRNFVEQNSQAAFAELARRHVGWIYQASLRRTGERHDLAQEVVQQVFLALARHAPALAKHRSLAGWLFITTRYAAGHVVRSESRRRKHESAAGEMNEPETHATDNAWTEIRPLLDEALDRLPERDRVASAILSQSSVDAGAHRNLRIPSCLSMAGYARSHSVGLQCGQARPVSI
jgi:RNA polymerase sigma factor (sigma-70 family)